MRVKNVIYLIVIAITLAIVCIALPINIVYFSNINNPWEISGNDIRYTRGKGPGYVAVNERTYYINENNIMSKSIQLQDGNIINSHGIKVEDNHILNINNKYTKLRTLNNIVNGKDSKGISLEYIGESDKQYGKLFNTDIISTDLSELSITINLYNTTYNLSKDIPSVIRKGYSGYYLYIRDTDELKQIRKENNKANKVLDELVEEAVKLNTEREQVKYIYNWLIKNVEYSTNIDDYSVYDTLINKRAVCEGFARTFYSACKKLGIQVRYIHGTEESSSEQVLHTWNAVKFTGDSVWTYYDSTWDSLGYRSYKKIKFFEMNKNECDKQHREECIHE